MILTDTAVIDIRKNMICDDENSTVAGVRSTNAGDIVARHNASLLSGKYKNDDFNTI